jgi:hypothetical protein
MLKRAQILVADLYGAFEGESYGEFSDIESLTMFPDYRVPQYLHHVQVLEYSPDLHSKILNTVQLPSRSNEEIEIRGVTIEACERLSQFTGLKSIEIDWLLWQLGESSLKEMIGHHRTLSIYY